MLAVVGDDDGVVDKQVAEEIMRHHCEEGAKSGTGLDNGATKVEIASF